MGTHIVIDLMRAGEPAELSLDLDTSGTAEQYADQLLDKLVLAIRIGADVRVNVGARRADLNAAVFKTVHGVVLGKPTPARVLRLPRNHAMRLRTVQQAMHDAQQHPDHGPTYLIASEADSFALPHTDTSVTSQSSAMTPEPAEQARRSPSSTPAASTRNGASSATQVRVEATETPQPDPAHSHQRDARERRNEILAEDEWLTAAEVELRVRDTSTDSNPSQFASRLRRERRLFGVRFRGQYLHPAFQFNPHSGQLHPALAAVLSWLPDEPDGWAAAFWLYQPSLHLQGQTPARVFAQDPEAVAQAAEKDFRRTDDEW